MRTVSGEQSVGREQDEHKYNHIIIDLAFRFSVSSQNLVSLEIKNIDLWFYCDRVLRRSR